MFYQFLDVLTAFIFNCPLRRHRSTSAFSAARSLGRPLPSRTSNSSSNSWAESKPRSRGSSQQRLIRCTQELQVLNHGLTNLRLKQRGFVGFESAKGRLHALGSVAKFQPPILAWLQGAFALQEFSACSLTEKLHQPIFTLTKIRSSTDPSWHPQKQPRN